MTEQTAQPGAPAAPAPAQDAPRAAGFRGAVSVESLYPAGAQIPPRGTAEYGNAVMTAARVEFGQITTEQARAELAVQVQPTDTNAASEPAAPAGEQSATIADPVQAMHASRELSAGLQETGEIAGLDKGTAEFYSQHLGEALQRPPITQAQSDAQQADTRGMLQQRYGAKAEQMIQDARAELAELTKRLPNLPAWLDHTGAGNDAGVIIRLAQRHAERARARILAGVRRR